MAEMDTAQEILHTLILINNQRASWYEKATAETRHIEPEVAELFEVAAEESRLYATELDEKIKFAGTELSMPPGIWSDAVITMSDTQIGSILTSSSHLEADVQEAYRRALKNTVNLDADWVKLLEKQQWNLKGTLDEVKAYRRESKAV